MILRALVHLNQGSYLEKEKTVFASPRLPELKRWKQEAQNLVGQIIAGEVYTLVASRLAEVQECLAQETPQLAQVREDLASLPEWSIPAEKVARILQRFDELWKAMTIVEKQKLLNLLIERVDYDGRAGQVTIQFHPSGLESLLPESLTENAA